MDEIGDDASAAVMSEDDSQDNHSQIDEIRDNTSAAAGTTATGVSAPVEFFYRLKHEFENYWSADCRIYTFFAFRKDNISISI